ncbi:unnamed protein product [Rhizoctonia solani]|uniref:Uncharacterized protein n=1 Tax=Rhizoctonia solani AG-3 Rhs1AP TaxID=1086054 RepID=X8JQQ2_9AGAM|nr:hypothetical protein RSOL_444680 [Rhizoctonia solani AG-3 Rhs1AP]CAE6526536.1 unnamed protein product [Rhizoctonia solani]
MASNMTPSNRRHASYDLHASVEKWDVVLWNDQVNSSHSQESYGQPVVSIPQESSFTSPRFATNASAFGLGSAPSRPRPIIRKPSHGSTVEPLQVRHEALSALHRSVQQHDADFLARMRELEQRCHLLPDSLSALRSEDLSCTRGRKRDIASWDDDGDVEMASWSERRRKHISPWGASSGLFGSDTPACDSDKTSAHSSDDEYVVATHEVDTDSHSSSGEDDDDDDLDIVIVPGGSIASSGSTPPSLSTSLSSLPTRADSHSHTMHTYTPLSCIPTTKKDVDQLAAAMAGGAGSVVEWSVSPDISGNESHCINDTAQAGALWA